VLRYNWVNKTKNSFMIKSNLLILLITLVCAIPNSKAQGLFTEIGVGIGNVVGEEHSLGKSEIYFNILKTYDFGQIGLDFSSGGNFIPGTRSIMVGDVNTLSPNDTRFGAVSAFYRLPIIKSLYLEPRLGYASLSYFVHTDDQRKINQPNFTYGLGVGTTLLNKLSLSLRYQHLGSTAAYEGQSDRTTVISNSESVQLVLLRIAYRFSWDSLFKK